MLPHPLPSPVVHPFGEFSSSSVSSRCFSGGASPYSGHPTTHASENPTSSMGGLALATRLGECTYN